MVQGGGAIQHWGELNDRLVLITFGEGQSGKDFAIHACLSFSFAHLRQSTSDGGCLTCRDHDAKLVGTQVSPQRCTFNEQQGLAVVALCISLIG